MKIAWFCIFLALTGFVHTQAEPTPRADLSVAYTLGVAEGARLEALKHCQCGYRGYLGEPCK